jgi:radical SAM-linked protein
MVTLKYLKTGAAKYISHIDLLRHMERIIRRGEIDINFSQGFNPHALMFFSPPVVLGIESKAEYVTLDTDMASSEVLRRYNASAPEALRATAVYPTIKSPNLAGNARAAEYIFPLEWKDEFVGIMSAESLPTQYTQKGALTTEDLRPKILGVSEKDGKLCMVLSAGNVNLRADRAAEMLSQHFGCVVDITNITKTKLLVCATDGTIVEGDTFLRTQGEQ